MDDACALSGRRGVPVKTDDPLPLDYVVLEHADLPSVEVPEPVHVPETSVHMGG